ncbi:MAG: hypothetical protein ABI358_11270 [Ginsengibacter sp.]
MINWMFINLILKKSPFQIISWRGFILASSKYYVCLRNPVCGKWNLAKNYLDYYYYLSARFYETGVDEFGFLNNLYHSNV